MFNLIASILAWFYSITHSYGASIVLLTLVVMAVTTPFTLKGTKSMLQMQRLQPQLKAIQAKHKNDREKMNAEMMAFYKENNINPIGGCLPMVIQIPVFLVLFRVLRGLTRRITNYGLQAGLTAISVPAGIAFAVAPDPKNNFHPGYISSSSELYKSLSATSTMKSWGLDMSESASDALGRSIGHAIPYLVLILAVLATSVYQQRQISGRNPGGGMGNPQQQAIMKIMPFFLPVFSFAMPSGLVVYFVVSNLWRVGQNAFITHTLYGHPDSIGQQVLASRSAVIEADATETEAEAERPARRAAGGAGRNGTKAAKDGDTANRPDKTAAKSPMGRNRTTDGDRPSKVGGRLRALDNGGKGKGTRDGGGPATSYTSGRVTPKGDQAKGKNRKSK